MFLTENQQKWANIITEEYGVKDANRLSWMSQYAQVHEVFEAAQTPGADVNGIYATSLNTMGMGNPLMPSKPGFAGGAFDPAAKVGSGDIPMSTLTMALQVAAVTVGFELVPVIPATGPWAMLSYMDFPYAGGKYDAIGNLTDKDGKGPGADNKPIYIKFPAIFVAETGHTLAEIVKDCYIEVKNGTKLFKGTYLGVSRIDGSTIVQTISAQDGDDDISIATIFKDATTIEVYTDSSKATKIATSASASRTPDLVTSAADHIQGFVNFYDGKDDPMSRAENETGVGNTIGARMFTKLIQMGAYEVTGAVTRQQLQDMPLYGVDVIGKVLEHMQNEISQGINNRILDRVFKLGVTNAANQYKYQGVNFNLFMSGAGTSVRKMQEFASADYYVGIDGVNEAKQVTKGGTTTTGRMYNVDCKNAILNTAAENQATIQRRIMSRLLAAANLIAVVSRRGRGTWACTNAQIVTALQDAANYVVAPMINNLAQDGSQSLYFAGSIAGLNLYVDPYMKWNDNRVCVGRKSNGNDPGVVFMPYILADTVQITAEGTMAPKLLVNSRYAIVDAGFWPEQSYYTFMVDADNLI